MGTLVWSNDASQAYLPSTIKADQALDQVNFLRVKMPDELKEPEIGVCPKGSRIPIKIPAQTPAASSNQTMIKFEISSDYYLDMTDAVLSFEATVDGGAGQTYKRFADGLPIFDKVVLRRDNQIFWQEDNRQLIQEMTRAFSQKPARNAAYAEMEGRGTQYQRTQWAKSNRRYLVPINVGPMNTHYWPARHVGKFMLEFYFADAKTCVETNGTSPSYSLDNIQLLCNEVILAEDVMASVKPSNHFVRPYSGVHVVTDPLRGNGGDININLQAASVTAIVLTQHKDNWKLPYINDKYQKWPYQPADKLATPATLRAKLDLKQFPPEDIQLGGTDPQDKAYEPYRLALEWQEAFNQLGGTADRHQDIPLDLDNYVQDKFHIPVQMRLVTNEPSLLSAVNTKRTNGSPLILTYKWNQPPTDTYVIYALVHYIGLLTVSATNGPVVISKFT